MSADQKWGIFVIACGAVIIARPHAIRLVHWIVRRVDRWATRNVARMVDDGLAILATTDDDFAEYADEAIAITRPLYGSEAAQRIYAVIAHNEAQRFDPDAVDWTERRAER